jgi:Flp pilus assembly protein TadD
MKTFIAGFAQASLLAWCMGVSGCAAFGPDPAAPAGTDRAGRRGADLAAFEQKRDEAQFIAARERAEQGELEAAEMLLTAILERSPEHVESRLLLADLWVVQDRTAEAERELRWVLKHRPHHARAHHSLGLLCDVTGRSKEAAEHFGLAAQSAPQEDAYRLALEACVGGAPAEPTQIAGP